MELSDVSDVCSELLKEINSLQLAMTSKLTVVVAAKVQLVQNCASGEIDKYLENYIAARNSLSEIEADLESYQASYDELCV